MQRIIRDYYNQLYANKMDHLEEKDKFIERYSLPKLNEEEIANMNDNHKYWHWNCDFKTPSGAALMCKRYHV